MKVALKSLPLMFVGLVSAGAAATVQPNTGTNVPGRETSSTTTHLGTKVTKATAEVSRARESMRRFAQCIVTNKKRRSKAAEVVLDDVPNSMIREKYSGLIDPDCLPYGDAAGMTLSLPADFFRYAMAEALIAVEFSQPIADFKGVPPLTHHKHDPSKFISGPGKHSKKELQQLEMARLTDLAEIFVSKYGECVVRLDPINSHELLSTKQSSTEEDTVFSALYPSLASCLATGQKVTMNKAMARGTIAVNYYRLAKAAGGAQ
jgi:hypothetical protein